MNNIFTENLFLFIPILFACLLICTRYRNSLFALFVFLFVCALTSIVCTRECVNTALADKKFVVILFGACLLCSYTLHCMQQGVCEHDPDNTTGVVSLTARSRWQQHLGDAMNHCFDRHCILIPGIDTTICNISECSTSISCIITYHTPYGRDTCKQLQQLYWNVFTLIKIDHSRLSTTPL